MKLFIEGEAKEPSLALSLSQAKDGRIYVIAKDHEGIDWRICFFALTEDGRLQMAKVPGLPSELFDAGKEGMIY